MRPAESRNGGLRARVQQAMRLLLVLPLFFASLPQGLWACSCAGPPGPCEASGASAAVFTGTVVSMTPGARATPREALSRLNTVGLFDTVTLVRFLIDMPFHGVAAGQTEIEVTTPTGGATCGYPFTVGTAYVVYAYRDHLGRLFTSRCSRTRPVTEASTDLAYFRSKAQAPPESRLSVQVRRLNPADRAPLTILLQQGATIAGRARTDSRGQVVFPAVPPGSYTVHVEGDGAVPGDPAFDVPPRSCKLVTFPVGPVIVGRVFTKTGVAEDMPVALRNAEGRTVAIVSTDTEGRFTLHPGWVGEFLLAVEPASTSPRTHWFHPGTNDAATATRIRVTPGRTVQRFDITLPEAPGPAQ